MPSKIGTKIPISNYIPGQIRHGIQKLSLENGGAKEKEKQVAQSNISILENQGKPIDNLLRCRYEMKYFVSEAKARAIGSYVQSLMSLDQYSKRQGGGYPIATLYLDSPNLQLCRESLDGHKNRFKLRVRTYTDNLDDPCFLEIKRRMNGMCMKDRIRIDRFKLEDTLLFPRRFASSENYGADHQLLNQFMLYVNSINAAPVIKIRYMRQAYEDDSHNRVRITFDRRLMFKVVNTADISLNGNGWQFLSETGVVVEVKFTDNYPAWIVQMIRIFNLQRQSFSKYARSVERSCLMGFCSPQIDTGRILGI